MIFFITKCLPKDSESVTSHTQRKHIKNGNNLADSDLDDDKVKLEELGDEEFDPTDVGNEYKCTREDIHKYSFEDFINKMMILISGLIFLILIYIMY